MTEGAPLTRPKYLSMNYLTIIIQVKKVMAAKTVLKGTAPFFLSFLAVEVDNTQKKPTNCINFVDRATSKTFPLYIQLVFSLWLRLL